MKKRLIITIILLALFIAVGYPIFDDSQTGYDIAIQNIALSLRNDTLSAVAAPFSYSGNWPVPTIICAILLLIPATRFAYGIPLSVSALSSVGIYQALKYLIKRTRPDEALHLVVQGGYSFPSGHSQTSLMVWVLLICLLVYYYKTNGKALPLYRESVKPGSKLSKSLSDVSVYPHSKSVLLIWCIGLGLYAFLMGLSRIYVCVHWPSDVFGGWIVGTIALIWIEYIFVESKKEK